MRKNHRPMLLEKLAQKANHWYVNKIIRPQFDVLGHSENIHKPQALNIFGHNICAGNYLHIVADKLQPVKITTWHTKQNQGHINLGDYCLIAPGVEITSAQQITIGNNTMIAAECILSDSDWHGTYNRIRPFRCTAPIEVGNNVWIGKRAIVCKGISIGDNSIIGAGAVVTKNLPANVIAAGNPAKIVKHINPDRRMLKRDYLFTRIDNYWQQQIEISEYAGHNNGFLYWLKTLIAPSNKD